MYWYICCELPQTEEIRINPKKLGRWICPGRKGHGTAENEEVYCEGKMRGLVAGTIIFKCLIDFQGEMAKKPLNTNLESDRGQGWK